MVRRLVVTADDTTGALETAATCADDGWAASVGRHASTDDDARGDRSAAATRRLDVVDLRSRHLDPVAAAARMRQVLARVPDLRAHKIDSTLRGNWADEIAAVVASGHQVLMVPAFPAAGRTCVGGSVLVDGVPVDRTAFADDPRAPVRSSRPADRLTAAVTVAHAEAAREALGRGVPIVVADAATDVQVAELAAVAATHDRTVIAGPSAVVTAFVRALVPAEAPSAAPGGPATSDGSATSDGLAIPGGSAVFEVRSVLVVSASQHPAAVAQCATLAERGAVVLRPPADARIADADAVLAALGRAALDHLDAHPSVATVVLIGGDTAAAVLGDATVRVHGSLGVGVAAGSAELAGRPVRVVAQPGGFGRPDTLASILAGATIR